MSYKYNPFTCNLDIVGSGAGGGTAALQEAIGRIATLEGNVAVNNITIDEHQYEITALAARLTALESA